MKNENHKKDKSLRESREEKKLNRNQMADIEIQDLETRIKEETPPTGFYYLNNEEEEKVISNADEKWAQKKLHFNELPLTKKTIRGLTESRFVKMTPIQRSSLMHSLSGRDIIGASKTGSGKTLCFVIPVLEILYRQKWSSLDGLGALLILPTRELAIQVFEVFKRVGKYHDFSCGLVIGGNKLQDEQDRLHNINILIGTPGRLLQHFSETPYFNTDNLKLLVIDEVDRILDEGFENTLNEILTYLPMYRQSLLYSATLTRSLKRLAKVNLKSAEYINLNNTDTLIGETENITEKSEIGLLSKSNVDTSVKFQGDNSITPINLNQFYTHVETHEKIDILYAFLKSHKNSKCLVFLNSCKQVRFFYEIFKRLKLGMTFLDLHGKQKQSKRTNIFYSFLQKTNTVLFATDIASRGVDFPHVDWVIQLDCPSDVQTYIHRVGRTARYKSKGNSILFVNPKENKFIDTLNNKKISIKKIKINQSKLVNLEPLIRSILSETSDLIYLAQKAISSYIKSIYLQKDKEIFDISSINIERLAMSYGLVNVPELTIMKKSQNDLKNKNRDDNIEEEEEYAIKEQVDTKKKSKLQKLKDKIKQKKLQKSSEIANILNNSETQNIEKLQEEDDFLQEKRKSEHDLEEEELPKKSIKKRKTEISHINVEESNNFYENIKKRLEKNKESDKTKEKIRVLEKHKNDRIKRKQHDYEKHGLMDDEDEEEESPPELEEEEITTSKQSKKKVNINLKNSTLEEKEKAVLELIENTDSIFV